MAVGETSQTLKMIIIFCLNEYKIILKPTKISQHTARTPMSRPFHLLKNSNARSWECNTHKEKVLEYIFSAGGLINASDW